MKYFLAIPLLIFSTHTFAMFCPTNFSQINIGDNIIQVLSLCGKPASQNSYKKSINLSGEWDYYVRTHSDSQATAKMAVIFQNAKVININIADNRGNSDIYAGEIGNHQSFINIDVSKGPLNVASTDACGSTISIGDSMQQVENACGKPPIIGQNQQSDSQNTVEITELAYTGPNPATLVFEDGILKDRVT